MFQYGRSAVTPARPMRNACTGKIGARCDHVSRCLPPYSTAGNGRAKPAIGNVGAALPHRVRGVEVPHPDAHDVLPATCCLLSALLGNRVMSERLLEAVESLSPATLDVHWFSGATYRAHPAPAWARVSDDMEAEWVAGRWLAASRLPAEALYFVNSPVLAAAARRRAPRARWVVATDATPVLTDRLRARAYGPPTSRARVAFRRLQSARFRRLARGVDLWLPMSLACLESLVGDYGVAPERCLWTSAPQRSVDATLPPRDPRARPWRLLFVGNDFARKGGPELCAALATLPEVHLTLVSRDPEARRAAAGEPRIALVDDVTDPAALAPLYRDAHLLVHPTLVDHYSHVICEGLARGLPFAVTTWTPPAELIPASEAGAAIAWPPSADSISRAVRRRLEAPDAWAAACARALAFAQRELAAERFRERLATALAVTGAAPAPGAAGDRTGRAQSARLG
jgi:glycosyltransferase involved in cell wall biosynthesis